MNADPACHLAAADPCFLCPAGIRRFDPSDNVIESFPDAATEARAVLEAQFMSMRVHGEALGMRPKTIIVTGGASQNTAICQVLADVFGCEVSAAVQPDSASLGAAYRAMHAVICEERGEFVPYVSALDWDPVASHHTVATPNGSAHEVYSVLCDRYVAGVQPGGGTQEFSDRTDVHDHVYVVPCLAPPGTRCWKSALCPAKFKLWGVDRTPCGEQLHSCRMSNMEDYCQ